MKYLSSRTLVRAIPVMLGALLSFTAMAKTDVILLGTGTPVPDASRSGPSTAVVYNDRAFVFDAGGGMVQRAIEAAQHKGIKALYPTNIQHVFLTHLHSDHILDVSELAATYWWRRDEKLSVYGPIGTKKFITGYYDMLSADIRLRTSGKQPVKNPTLYQVNVTEYTTGNVVYNQGGVTIEAFKVPHGDIRPAFGYKITTPDRVVVISGDTAYSEAMKDIAKNADVLVHEVISDEGLAKLPPFWQKYHSSSHTKTDELAKIANAAQPKLLVLSHILHYSASVDSVLEEVQASYDGDVVIGNDLDVF
ncbi:MBL fold metallo-hydrolase [Photobacterium sanctipauli]|uniref:MBL fold metallo-hydrolase n=1 Tax=Photobacterium sanctipauli TaxID=1342794 RepID=A0A2T3P185_9GAMM|nr:MBL fold metallo-hydrolase [Photobacterium sanctipauli]PSW22228.1 MBL fold metallo-hydrolase [Photobacterium sanctipauli]